MADGDKEKHHMEQILRYNLLYMSIVRYLNRVGRRTLITAILLASIIPALADSSSSLTQDKLWLNKQVGWWYIAQNYERNTCLAFATYGNGPGESLIWFGIERTGETGFLALGNGSWSFIDPNKEYLLKFVFNGRDKKIVSGIGAVFQNTPVLIFNLLDSEIVNLVAEARTVEVYSDEFGNLENYSLRHTKKALAAVKDCISDTKNRAEREESYSFMGVQSVEVSETRAQQAGSRDLLGAYVIEIGLESRSRGEAFVGGVAHTSALEDASPLPATGPEARAAMQVLGGDYRDIVAGRAASETEIKSAKLSSYRVLYLAPHGLLSGEIEELAKVKAEPALLFAVPEKPIFEDDGLLTASEVAQLKLNAVWAVLSACNTAAGGKPGAAALSGLARAFFYAGARSLLVSPWPVEDEASKALMVRLFETVKANPGMRAAEAQQAAMLSVMNDPEHLQWANPAYWAPFILVGEPRRTDVLYS